MDQQAIRELRQEYNEICDRFIEGGLPQGVWLKLQKQMTKLGNIIREWQEK
jgi:flagellar biosynthesis chaperone FliJ